ncbi:aminoglycoside phosphotransferase family protein [bacterium]|nr:aminoglycoside phosphotransferase family protein [bacterium]
MRKAFQIKDDRIRNLAQCLDSHYMARAFQDFFDREYPDRRLKVESCRLRKIYHKPGLSCQINYSLHGEDDRGRPFERSFIGKLFANPKTALIESENPPQRWPGCDFWKPVSVLPSSNMLLHVFPYDSRLPYLGQLLESDYIKRTVEQNMGDFGLPKALRCQDVVVRSTKYRYGKSCLLRYKVTLTNGKDEPRHIDFYSKTYKNKKSRYIYRVLKEIAASLACQNGKLNIPVPIALIDEANTLWQHRLLGNNLSRVAHKIGWANIPESGILESVSSMIAALHQVEISNVELSLGPSFELVIENARSDVNDILGFLPEMRPKLQRVLCNLGAFVDHPDSSPQVLIHGTFKIAQILCHEEKCALVDFDSIALGNPLYDIGEFVSSLAYLTVSDQVPKKTVQQNVELFLSHYRSQVGWACDFGSIAKYVVVFLLGKIHASLKRCEPRATQNMPSAFELVEDWLDLARA